MFTTKAHYSLTTMNYSVSAVKHAGKLSNFGSEECTRVASGPGRSKDLNLTFYGIAVIYAWAVILSFLSLGCGSMRNHERVTRESPSHL